MSTIDKIRKKVLFVVTLAELGGAQKYVRDLTENLNKDFEITIAANTADTALLSWAEENSIRIFPLKNLNRELVLGVLPSLGDFRTFRELSRHVRAEKYDIVHLNSSKMGLIGAIAARTAKCPKIVFTAHGWVFNEPKTIRGKRWLWILISRLASRFQDQIICVSDYDLDQAVKHKIAPPRKMVTIRNGVDVNKITYLQRTKPRLELEKMINGSGSTVIAGTIANHYPTKDLGTMVEAIDLVKNKNLKLVIIGDGPERAGLKSRIKDQELADRVFLLGRIENAVKYLKAFDLYLISSLKEGHPFSTLEAMAAGLPVVSTRVGGLAETIFGNAKNPAGLEFSCGNAQEMAEKIERLIDNKELAETVGQNARAYVEAHFSLDSMVQKTRWVWG